ncbi:hypothetical protein [Methanosphaerula palustris]|nr:hypothetical protein [Methanosphaerula palustris]
MTRIIWECLVPMLIRVSQRGGTDMPGCPVPCTGCDHHQGSAPKRSD